jgi:molybdate transport system substrate-binding protein
MITVRSCTRLLCGLLLLLAFHITSAVAGEVQIAVAANFAEPMKELGQLFKKSYGHTVTVSVGATGQLYSQIKNGAPAEIFLAADMTTPSKLAEEGEAAKENVTIYAIGKLVLWSKDPMLVDAQGKVLKTGPFNHLAIANPKTAPYGAAAKQVLEKLGVWNSLQGKVVQGTSITQAYQFIATGNAELGFIALSQYHSTSKDSQGSHWLVPQEWYEKILQGAVLLKRGENNPAAKAFMTFLSTDKTARAVIEKYGYVLP